MKLNQRLKNVGVNPHGEAPRHDDEAPAARPLRAAAKGANKTGGTLSAKAKGASDGQLNGKVNGKVNGTVDGKVNGKGRGNGQANGGGARANASAVTGRAAHQPENSFAAFSGGADPLASLKQRAQEQLYSRLGAHLFGSETSEEELRRAVLDELASVLRADRAPLSSAERQRLVDDISRDVLGYGPIERFLADPQVDEIMVTGARPIYVERAGKLYATSSRFLFDDHLRRVIERIVSQVGRRIDESSPMVDARLPDGSRVNAVLPPLAVDGPTLTIRKFAKDPFRLDDLVRLKTMTDQMADLMAMCVLGRLNILITGGTGTGKTTLMNVLSSFIPAEERIVTIEDAVELQLHQEHVVRLEARPANVEDRGEVTIRDLVRNALRMRPDRIVVGEVRGGEALDMLQAMNTGHEGSLSTLHANTPRDALSRLETMVLMAGMELPAKAIREQIASAIDLIVQLTRFRDGTRRVTHVTEVHGMEGQVIGLQDIFLFDSSAGVDEDGRVLGTLQATGIRPLFADRLKGMGLNLPARLFTEGDPVKELRRR